MNSRAPAFSHARRFTLLCAIISILVTLDQYVKYIITQRMILHESFELIEGFFSLTYVRNYGVAFGMFSALTPALRNVVVLGLPALLLLVLIGAFFWREFRSFVPTLALILIVSGAVGNLIDRFTHGYVIDFFDLNLGFMRWPAFNMADIYVTCGGILILLFFVLAPKRLLRPQEGPEAP